MNVTLVTNNYDGGALSLLAGLPMDLGESTNGAYDTVSTSGVSVATHGTFTAVDGLGQNWFNKVDQPSLQGVTILHEMLRYATQLGDGAFVAAPTRVAQSPTGSQTTVVTEDASRET